MQRKLHHWAVSDPDRRFDDVFNLVAHPDFLTMAWERVRGNKGARTAGVDRVSPASIAEGEEVVEFLGQTREQLRSRTFAPLPVRERLIPKPKSSKLRRLGIPTAMDRVVQASLVLVLEPIFEADFKPVSYGFRPKRRAQDAIAEIHTFGSRNYHWVFEADIAACFDELAHSAIMDRVRLRIADKRVLALIKAFLKAGVMSADGQVRESGTGTPQGGIASPLLANIALSVLDEHFTTKWDAHRTSQRRDAHRKRGGATYRIVRYADDFVIMVAGTKAHADALWDEVAQVIAPLGLRLSAEKSRVCHLDEGFDFLGFRIQRRQRKGTTRSSVYTYPSKKALLSIMAKVRALTKREQHHGLADLLGRLNPVLRGWCAYFRHGVSKATFGYLDSFAWHRVTQWLLKRHKRLTWAELLPAIPHRKAGEPPGSRRDHHVRRDHGAGNPVPLAREQYPHTMGQQHRDLGSCVTVAIRGAPDAMRVARPVRRAGRGNGPGAIPAPRPGPTPTSSASATLPRSAPWSNAPPATRCWCTCPTGTSAEQVAPALAAKIQTLPEAAAPVADLGPGPGDARLETGPDRRRHRHLLLRPAHALAARHATRTPTACCASTSRRAPTCPCTAQPIWTRSPPNSTTDPANDSVSASRSRRSATCWPRRLSALIRNAPVGHEAAGA